LNKAYVFGFFKELEAIPFEDNWELRVDQPYAKCWTSANGSKFSKKIT